MAYIVLLGPVSGSLKLVLHVGLVGHKCRTSDTNAEALGGLMLCLAGYGKV